MWFVASCGKVPTGSTLDAEDLDTIGSNLKFDIKRPSIVSPIQLDYFQTTQSCAKSRWQLVVCSRCLSSPKPSLPSCSMSSVPELSRRPYHLHASPSSLEIEYIHLLLGPGEYVTRQPSSHFGC